MAACGGGGGASTLTEPAPRFLYHCMPPRSFPRNATWWISARCEMIRQGARYMPAVCATMGAQRFMEVVSQPANPSGDYNTDPVT
jgi:hypothetical protein